jgi:hypothetical protein
MRPSRVPIETLMAKRPAEPLGVGIWNTMAGGAPPDSAVRERHVAGNRIRKLVSRLTKVVRGSCTRSTGAEGDAFDQRFPVL